jgi:epoxyqueuosine reductase
LNPASLSPPPTPAQIKHQAQSLGFDLVGIAAVDSTHPVINPHLSAWLAQGYQADMAWMANPKRQDIYQVMPEVQSLICLGLNYYTPHPHSQDPACAKISRYGWGRDYHKVLSKKLKQFSQWLQAQGDGILTRYYVDTGPISEKAWAERAGLGWVGKHGNLISRQYGSWLFLGEILTNLALEPDRPHTAHCGTCTRCISACPTQAITQPFVVDANRCIAYHTIENRAQELPASIAANLQGWVAGCDICQDVCPWNQRFAQPTQTPEFQPYPANLAPQLSELAELSESEWQQRFEGSALRRIKLPMLQRNARANLRQTTVNPKPAPTAPTI